MVQDVITWSIAIIVSCLALFTVVLTVILIARLIQTRKG